MVARDDMKKLRKISREIFGIALVSAKPTTVSAAEMGEAVVRLKYLLSW